MIILHPTNISAEYKDKNIATFNKNLKYTNIYIYIYNYQLTYF